MPPQSKTKTKRVIAKSVSVRKKASRKNSVLSATTLGIAPEHLAEAQIVQSPSVILIARTLPPPNLPVGAHTSIGLRQPLVAPRTSFWLGVGFGMFVVGALVAITWQLFRVETVEAIVVGLTRPF